MAWSHICWSSRLHPWVWEVPMRGWCDRIRRIRFFLLVSGHCRILLLQPLGWLCGQVLEFSTCHQRCGLWNHQGGDNPSSAQWLQTLVFEVASAFSMERSTKSMPRPLRAFCKGRMATWLIPHPASRTRKPSPRDTVLKRWSSVALRALGLEKLHEIVDEGTPTNFAWSFSALDWIDNWCQVISFDIQTNSG